MKENCAECKHHDVFFGGSGCNLLNNEENCMFEPRKQLKDDFEEIWICNFEGEQKI